MRISSVVALSLLLVACENRPDNAVLAEAEERAAAQAGEDGKVECAINGDSKFNRECYTERLSGESGATMIIRHPDGGFRRFNLLTDGRGLESADGFEKASVSIVEDGKILVSVGPDRYLLPAQVKANAAAASGTGTAKEPAQAGN